MAMKTRLQEETLRRQEESIKKQEAIRKATIEHELQLRHKLDLERIEAEVKARAKAARENRDVNLEMMKAEEEEKRKTVIERIRTTGTVLGAGLNDFISDKSKITAAVSYSYSIVVFPIDRH
jgi:ATPase family AAA domain-containing protein 3A/B